MEDVLEKIINAGIHAPSGDNCQPWKFGIDDNKVFLFNLPDRDTSLYSWGQRASLIANGAVLENMEIAAAKFGYKTQAELFPSPDSDLVAIVNFLPAKPEEDPLYPAIFQRCTNRKPYKTYGLTEQQRQLLLSTNNGDLSGKVLIEENRDKIKELASAASMNEKVLFENYAMHRFFYNHILWTADEEIEKRQGFYVKTLEIPAPAMAGFKLAKKWSRINLLNKIGFSNLITKANFATYNACSAIGAVVINGTSAQDYITAGRLLQKTWLKTTSLGLSFQPLTGIALLYQRILNKEGQELSPSHQELIKNMYSKMAKIFNVNDQTIALMFRVGQGGEPSARTLRLPPNIFEHHS
jgi:hypothetical protein